MNEQSKPFKHWNIERDEDNIAWLHFDMLDSKVNLLSRAAISELDTLLDQLNNDLPQGVIILSDKPDSFVFGADIREFTELENEQQALEMLNEGHAVMNKLEALRCPTVTMIHGMCLGGGTELSLACDYRIASDDNKTRIGLPEIKLGIHPGYGGTERSIRRAGPMAAMDIMLTGRALPARSAAKINLIDEMVPLRQLKKAAHSWAMNAPKPKRPGLLARLANKKLARPLVAKQIRKQVARKAKKGHYPAPYQLIDLWEKYADDPRRMLEQEAASVAKLAVSESARNLVRVYFLQEKLKGMGKQVDYRPAHVHVIGGGLMGGDIAAWCSIQGYHVTVQDQEAERLAATMKRAHASFKKKFKRDRRSIIAAADRLVPDIKGHGIKNADLIIEAIFEDLEVKRALYKELEPQIKPDTILATNTSSIKLEDLSSALDRPGRLVGLHFFNPVAQMPLVEVIKGDDTDDEVMQQALAFARNIGKLPLPVKSSPGFLVNRILMPYLLEAVTMVDEGIAPEAIDKAATDFGMPMGPIELADTVGIDICKSVATILSEKLDMELPANLDKMVSNNKLGKKSGEGFYKYNKKGKPAKNKKASFAHLPEIQDRLVMRMLNEAAACLREGIVDNDDFVDAGVIFGTGFAPFRGGPIHYIRSEGAGNLVQRMDELKDNYGDRFTQDPAWGSLGT